MTIHHDPAAVRRPGRSRRADRAVRRGRSTTVRRWLAESAEIQVDPSAERLAGVLKDPRGLPVHGRLRRRRDPARGRRGRRPQLRRARQGRPDVPAAGTCAPRPGWAPSPGKVAPALVIPIVRRVLRGMVGHLIVDARDAQLGKAIKQIRDQGERLNVNLLGEAVLGEKEAARRLEGTHRLLDRDDIDYVSIKVSSTVAPHSTWAFDEAVEHVVESLTPLFRARREVEPGEVHQPRHGGVPRPRPHHRGLHHPPRPARVPRPRGRHRACRPTCPTRSAR